ncbi:MAG: hypothetical protein AAFY78_11885 [Cyanobacteria bacterium J06648_16]
MSDHTRSDFTQKQQATDAASGSPVPDPWEQHTNAHSQQVRQSWQVPLDPAHEIGAAPAAKGVLSPEGDPTVPRIPAHASRPTPTPTEAVLEEELRVSPTHQTLWGQIQNWLTLMIWGQQRPQ